MALWEMTTRIHGYFDFAPLGEEGRDCKFYGDGRFVAASPLEAWMAGWSM